MSDSPRIGMNLSLASENDLTWHRDQRFASHVLEALEANGLWFDFTRMELGADQEPLDRARLKKTAATGAPSAIELRAAGGEAYVAIETGGVLADLRLRTPPLDARGKQLLDGIIAWARAAAGTVGDRARVRSGAVYPSDIAYPQRRPPIAHDLVRLGTLVDFMGLSWLGEEVPEAVDAVVSGALPDGATRSRDGDLVVLRWVDDPSDPIEQARGCIRQEEWWAENLSLQPQEGWNALGDQAIIPAELERRPPFTLFDAEEETGYRALVIQPDGEPSGTSWPEIAQLTALRELPDGTPVVRVRLIVPVRESAVAIAEKARSLGVDAVVYKDEEETLWNVMPPGEWRPPGMASVDALRLDGPEPDGAKPGRRKPGGRRGKS